MLDTPQERQLRRIDNMHEISIEDIEKVNGGCPPCAVVAVVSLVESGATIAGAAAAIYSAYRYIRG